MDGFIDIECAAGTMVAHPPIYDFKCTGNGRFRFRGTLGAGRESFSTSKPESEVSPRRGGPGGRGRCTCRCSALIACVSDTSKRIELLCSVGGVSSGSFGPNLPNDLLWSGSEQSPAYKVRKEKKRDNAVKSNKQTKSRLAV